MGKLLNRRIVLSRVWIDPDAPLVNLDLDYDITYPVSIFNAIFTDMSDQALTLRQYFTVVEDKIEQKQDLIPAGPNNNLMMWSNKPGLIGRMAVKRHMSMDPGLRTYEALVSEKGLGEYIDTKASAEELSHHLEGMDPEGKNAHIWEREREYWNEMTPMKNFLKHLEDGPHFTENDRKTLNGKLDAKYFQEHTDADNPHDLTAKDLDVYTKEEVRDIIEGVQPRIFNYKNIFIDFSTSPPTYSLTIYDKDNYDPNYVFDYRYNTDYAQNPDIVLPDGSIFTVTEYKELPDLMPGKRYFAIVVKGLPHVDSRSALVQLYLKDETKPWMRVAETEVSNGDLFITYPDTRLYFMAGGRFLELVSVDSGAKGE